MDNTTSQKAIIPSGNSHNTDKLSGKQMEPEDISSTFCMLPWIHLSTRPNGHMRLCCTSNASSAGALNDKQFGGEVGILKKENGLSANFNHTDLKTAWNSTYNEIRSKANACRKKTSFLFEMF